MSSCIPRCISSLTHFNDEKERSTTHLVASTATTLRAMAANVRITRHGSVIHINCNLEEGKRKRIVLQNSGTGVRDL